MVRGWGFGGREKVQIAFADSTAGLTSLGTVTSDGNGAFSTQVAIPVTATMGIQTITARTKASGQRAKRKFTVT